MAKTSFRYRLISQKLLHELITDIERGTSAVIVGPSNAGKGLLSRKLSAALAAHGCGPIIKVNFRRGGSNAEAARNLVSEAIQAAGFLPGRGEKILSPLTGVSTPVYLFLTNPDALPCPLTRTLLQEVWLRVRDKSVIAIMRGEHDFGEFIYESPSDLNVAQYMIQGIGRDLLPDYLRQYEVAFSMRFTQEAQEEIMEHTNGVGDHIRTVLLAIVEARVRDPELRREPSPSGAEIQSAIERMQELGFGDEYFLRQVIRLLSIERKPRVFKNLRVLLEGGRPALDQPGGVPGSLTLSGLAIRAEGSLYPASKLMLKIARRYLTPPRIAHFHAQAGRFEEAFALLENPDLSVPPWNVSLLAATVRAASAELHRQASSGYKALWQFFASVCRKLLGLAEVSFWEFRTCWEPVFGDPSAAMRRACNAALTLDYRQQDATSVSWTFENPLADSDAIRLPPLWAGSMLGWNLTGLSKGWSFAVFVGTATEKNSPPEPVVHLIREFAGVFQQAHAHAVNQERLLMHRRFLDVVSRIVENIDRRFLEHDPTIPHILSELGALEELGYSDVSCRLFDQVNGWIYRIGAIGEPKQRWRSDDFSSSLHAYVIRRADAVLVHDVRNNDFARDDPYWQGRTGAIAVCPICGAGDQAIGTIEFSRKDGQLPSRDEIDDFIGLAKKLAMFFGQSNRLRLLQEALGKNREALVIFNSLGEPIFADQQAADMFGFRPGWTVGGTEVASATRSRLAEIGTEAFRRGKIARLDPQFPGAPGPLSIYGDAVNGWSGDRAGSFLSILDFSEDYRIFDAFKTVSQAIDVKSGFRYLLDAVRGLGYTWARIYWHRNRQLRSSEFQYGLIGEAKTTFESGGVILKGWESWRCLRKNKVIVFCKTKENRSFETDLGVLVRGISESNEGIVQKSPGDFWIEAPLVAGDKWLGKISLTGVDLTGERVAFLEAFFSLVSRLLEALSRAESERFEIVGRLVTKMAHVLLSQVRRLDRPLEKYERATKEHNTELLAECNKSFKQIQSEMTLGLQRFMEGRHDVPAYEEFDLVSLVKGVFGETAGCECKDSFKIEADKIYLSEAFTELLSNSRKWFPVGLRIVVRISEVDVGLGPWCQIDVEDNGPGFHTSMITGNKALEYFMAYHPKTNVLPGTGVGLAVVRERIIRLGGDVDIYNTEPSGAGVRLRFPRWRKFAGLGKKGIT